jgi:serine/threonine protein kinase
MLEPNTLLQNRYSIVRSIGRGGMGAVYLAKDRRLGNTVALKETFFTEARMRRAFEREARLLAHLRHPALPKVIDHFDEGDGQFLVMEFIPGDDLEMLLAQRGRPFPPEQVLRWADQMLDALEYLHTQETPILHRDIKPANLKLTARDQIILLDFGLAKGSADYMTSLATNRSVLGFTPNFAPLEQIQGTGTDPRSDLYSLAATLYYLMTEVIPPNALSRATASVSQQPDPLRPAHEVNAQVKPGVANLLMQAMALNPNLRPATAAQMRQALHEASQSNKQDSGIKAAEALPQTIIDDPSAPPPTIASPVQAYKATAPDITSKSSAPLIGTAQSAESPQSVTTTLDTNKSSPFLTVLTVLFIIIMTIFFFSILKYIT